MKLKKLPSWVKHKKMAWFFKTRPMVFLSYWIFQGMLYMDWREVIFKLFLDIFLFTLFRFLGVTPLLSLIYAHTTNMLINGHFFTLMRYSGFWKIKAGVFADYIEFMQRRIARIDFLQAAAAYGSLSRQKFSNTSDIDIRVFSRKGFFNIVKTIVWVFLERFRALLFAFPLDIYMFDLEVIDKKMRTDEPPIIFLDKNEILKAKYKNFVDFSDFIRQFREKYVYKTQVQK